MIGHMMSCFQSRRLSSRSSVRLLRCTLIVAVIACFHYQSAPWLLFAALAGEVVHLVNRYSEVACGAMIAGEIVDKLLALPATVTRTVEMIGKPAQNGAKREFPRCSKCSISFTMRVARHDKLPK